MDQIKRGQLTFLLATSERIHKIRINDFLARINYIDKGVATTGYMYPPLFIFVPPSYVQGGTKVGLSLREREASRIT